MWNYLGRLGWLPLLYFGYQIHLYLLGWGCSPYLTFPMGLICGVIISPFLALNILSFAKWKAYYSFKQRKREK